MTQLVYDLHTHSHCSDGQLSPEALVALAKDNGVDVLALTDHDTISGIAQAEVAAGNDISIIAGIEFSAQWLGIGVHIVGLQVDPQSTRLSAAIATQTQTRNLRAQAIAERLEKVGIHGAFEGALHCANGGSIGRPHFAQFMLAQGYVSSMNQAFKKYLGAGKIGDVKQGWPLMSTVVSWINDAGGIAVLAHPNKYRLTRTKLHKLLQDFKSVGGQAVEVVSGQQDPQVTRDMASAANKFALLASCGSDFHAPNQSWQMLGKHCVLPDNCQPVWSLFK